MKQVKDMIVHNQVQNLTQLYVMLASTLNPTIIQNREGPCDVIPCGIPKAAQGAMEVALIDVCNRISEMAKDSARWTVDKADERDYNKNLDERAREIEAQMIAAMLASGQLEMIEEEKPKKKGKSDEQK